MKRCIWILLLFVASAPAWAGRKITVAQLEEMLRTMQQDKKNDTEISTALKQIELSEELTRARMNALLRYVPGARSTEQVYVLEARSADLIPPPADLPSTPAPDPAAQQAILAKAAAYVTGTYDRQPALLALRTTLRFQDNVEAIASSSGITGSATEVVTRSGFSNPAGYIHFMNSTESPVAFNHGAERPRTEKDKIAWGANKMIAVESPAPSLGIIFHEAQSAGELKFLRWELVNGTQTAVYSFTVPKKKSRLDLNVCCFPTVKQAGVATFYSSTTAPLLSDGAGGGGGGVAGNFQTNTDWYNYKTSAPYHGEFFIDPATGIVVRMITEAELRPAEVVHQFDSRIDYAPIKVGDKNLVVPVKALINTVVVPNGDSGAGGYSTRCTLFTSEYKNYQLESAR